MALGTPTSRGVATRNSGTSNISGDTFTPAANSLIFLVAQVGASSATDPDSISGHDGGTAWAKVGSTLQISTFFSLSLWAAHTGGSPSSGSVTLAYSSSTGMKAHIVEVTGADVSGTLANSFIQTDSKTGYGNQADLVLTSTTKATVGFWHSNNFPALTEEDTLLDQVDSASTASANDYNTSGNDGPGCGLSFSNDYGCFAVEIREAGGGGGTTLQGSLTMMGVGI